MTKIFKTERNDMRNTIGFLTFCLLAGCAGSPPKPPAVKGEYQPINKIEVVKKVEKVEVFHKEEVKPAPTDPVIPTVFDFQYEGDIVNSLGALRTIQPQLEILPTIGKVAPLPVRVSLHGTTLGGALKALGEQGGKVADVVLNSTRSGGGNKVFIRFNAPDQQPRVTPSEFTGSFNVTRSPTAPAIPTVFDFHYEGDIVNSLEALRAIQPQLNIMAPVGKVVPLPVRVNLHGTTLDGALNALGEQGGDVADVFWYPRLAQAGNRVFIRFNSPNKQP